MVLMYSLMLRHVTVGEEVFSADIAGEVLYSQVYLVVVVELRVCHEHLTARITDLGQTCRHESLGYITRVRDYLKSKFG